MKIRYSPYSIPCINQIRLAMCFCTNHTQNVFSSALSSSLVLISMLIGITGSAQLANLDYEKHDITPDPQNFLHVDLEMLPDGKHAIVTSVQNKPVYIIDVDNFEISREIDAGDWHAGSRASISTSGKYLLLQQLFYMDMSPNKDRQVTFEVIEIATGRKVLKIGNAHSAQFHPNEEELIVLKGDNVYSYSLLDKGERELFPVREATNCVAISPDGTKIAVTHKPEKSFLKAMVKKQRTKKYYKANKKYRQCITVYDAQSFKELYTVEEFYDIPYCLEFSPDGSRLLCYSIPHKKMSKYGVGTSKYICTIDSESGEALRTAFISNSYYEPDFEISPDGELIAVCSLGSRFPEVLVYDFNDGSVISRFTLATRFLEGIGKGEYPSDGRIGLDFTQDGNALVFTSGSRIMKWNYKSNSR